MELIADNGKALRGDLVRSVVLRSDITPIPATVEIEVMANETTTPALKDGATIYVGAKKTPFVVVKPSQAQDNGLQQGERPMSIIRATCLHKGTLALASPLQRSVIREGSSWAEIYRVIGATSTVAVDFTVPRFAALIGGIPTRSIAQVLQEEGATMYLKDEKLYFRRINELMQEAATIKFTSDRTEAVSSELLERATLPMVLSTDESGKTIVANREAGRALVYQPRANSRILANMGKVLMLRRKLRQALTPDLGAGTRIDIAGKPYVVITAAHTWKQSGQGEDSGENTILWLGDSSK